MPLRLDDRVALRLAKSCEVRSWSLPRAGDTGRGVASWEGILCVLLCFVLKNLLFFPFFFYRVGVWSLVDRGSDAQAGRVRCR